MTSGDADCELAAEVWGPELVRALWLLENEFTSIDQARICVMRRGVEMVTHVYLETALDETGNFTPQSRCFEGEHPDLVWALCAALQDAANAGLHTGVPAPPPPPPSQ